MSRKKADQSLELFEGSDSRATQIITKEFGASCIVSGSIIIDRKPEVVSLSPRLDNALGGGLQVGTLVTMAGPSGCGKTTTALHFAGKWQKRGGTVYYIAAEHRIFQRDLKGIPGLDAESMKIIWSSKDRILTAQDFLLAADTILRNETNALVIVDSFSILSEENEMMSKEYGNLQPGGANRLVGSFCRKMSPIIPVNNNMLIGIAHFYTNIGGKKKWAVSLGSKVNYARSTGLVCDWSEPIMDGEKSVGQTVHWRVERSALSAPNVKVDSIIRYGEGIDEIAEAIDMGIEFGLLLQKGSWIEMPLFDNQKVQGKEKARNFLLENPSHFETLMERIRYFVDE